LQIALCDVFEEEDAELSENTSEHE